MLILVLLGMYFDAVVVFVTSQTLLFRLALAILWPPGSDGPGGFLILQIWRLPLHHGVSEKKKKLFNSNLIIFQIKFFH